TGFAGNNGWRGRIWQLVGRLFALGPEQGAQTVVYLAASPEVEGVGGKYFVRERAVPSSPASYDEDAARRLWELSLELTSASGCGVRDGPPGQPRSPQPTAAAIMGTRVGLGGGSAAGSEPAARPAGMRVGWWQRARTPRVSSSVPLRRLAASRLRRGTRRLGHLCPGPVQRRGASASTTSAGNNSSLALRAR